jgi:hypothetical protein
MSKFVNIPNGNYKLSVQSGGTITFDTGENVGDVIVTGDLTVMGVYQIVGHQAADITDTNLIVLDPTAILNGKVAGLEVNGDLVDPGYKSYFLYDTDEEAWKSLDSNSALVPIITNRIISANSGVYADFNFTVGNANKLTITGTNYENNVVSNNDIPNKKYVDDAIASNVLTITKSGTDLIDKDDGYNSEVSSKTIDTTSTTNTHAMEYLITAYNAVSHYYKTCKLLLQVTNNSVIFTEYSVIKSNESHEVINYVAELSGGDVLLKAYTSETDNVNISFIQFKC